jgi:cytoplasmic iron level regulating protein YaaA (DUF328/UPF0246 family)
MESITRILLIIWRDRVIRQWSQQLSMSVLLIQSCSKSKNSTEEAVPALDLYTGYFFKIIKKAMREDEFDEDIDICILSAEYGLVEAQKEIEWYDRRMSHERAEELAPTIYDKFTKIYENNYDTIIVNVGNDYREALPEFNSIDNTDIVYIEGEGIGIQGHKLKQAVRGDLSAIQTDTVKQETV